MMQYFTNNITILTDQMYEIDSFIEPGLCNKIRDEALTHHKSGSLASKA